MFKEIKNWIINKARQFKVWIVVGALGVGVVLAAGELPITKDTSLQLKVHKDQIINSREYTEYEYDADGKVKSQKKIVSYSYKSGEDAPKLKNEIIEKRTANIVTRNLGGDKRSVQSGYEFYQDNGWKKVKHATTTPEVFNKVSWIKRVWAADTGANSPGTMADDNVVGTLTWSNPDNAKISDNYYADINGGPDGGLSHYLKATNFGFSIPTGATIDGILVEIEKNSNEGNDADNEVKIVKSDGSIGTTNKAIAGTFPYGEAYYSYGGVADLWGETWTPAKINDSDFGVVYSADIEGGFVGRVFIDHIRITVYYTEEAVATPAEVFPRTGIILIE